MTAHALGAHFGAEILGDPTAQVSHLASLEDAGTGALCYFADAKYAKHLDSAQGAVVLTRPGLQPANPAGATFLIVENPQSEFAAVAAALKRPVEWSGVSEQAVIGPGCEIHPSAHIGPFAVLGEGVRVGAGTRIFPYVYIGAGVQIGAHCQLHPRVCVYDGVKMGDRVTVFAGAVIGSDGFGLYRPDPKGPYREMPQIGTVVIEDDVRIGANSTIDRATLNHTRIQRGAKIDNLVHVGHNSDVGPNSILCAQVGLGGSTVLESEVVLGGQVGLGHGVRVGAGAQMGGQCGSTTNVAGGETYFFTPATPVREFARIYRALRKLPGLFSRVRELEARVSPPKETPRGED